MHQPVSCMTVPFRSGQNPHPEVSGLANHFCIWQTIKVLYPQSTPWAQKADAPAGKEGNIQTITLTDVQMLVERNAAVAFFKLDWRTNIMPRLHCNTWSMAFYHSFTANIRRQVFYNWPRYYNLFKKTTSISLFWRIEALLSISEGWPWTMRHHAHKVWQHGHQPCS